LTALDSHHLHVVIAYHLDSSGALSEAFEPLQAPSLARAMGLAKDLSSRYIGVRVTSWTSDPANGDYGLPEVIYQVGTVPDDDQ
jgi:hypothetical protein